MPETIPLIDSIYKKKENPTGLSLEENIIAKKERNTVLHFKTAKGVVYEINYKFNKFKFRNSDLIDLEEIGYSAFISPEKEKIYHNDYQYALLSHRYQEKGFDKKLYSKTYGLISLKKDLISEIWLAMKKLWFTATEKEYKEDKTTGSKKLEDNPDFIKDLNNILSNFIEEQVIETRAKLLIEVEKAKADKQIKELTKTVWESIKIVKTLAEDKVLRDKIITKSAEKIGEGIGYLIKFFKK